jgi:type 1 glutamine amidotransferase
MGARIDVLLVCGGRYHDFDFARLELLRLLHAHERLRVRVREDYSDLAAIARADCLITYTCDVVPDEAGEAALRQFVESGKRWHALHATNSIIEWTAEGKVAAPRRAGAFMRLLGSQFIAHPPIGPFRVMPTEPDHPLVRGIGAFDVIDELYLSEMHGENRMLLHTHFNGIAQTGFVEADWFGDERRAVLYLHAHGAGAVLYNTLGHCRGKYDMQPLIEEYPAVERCAWMRPEYHELLERGIRWMARLDSEPPEGR